MTRKTLIVATTLLATLCFPPPPAYADDFLDERITSPVFGPQDGVVPGAKKVVTLTLTAGTFAALGASFVFLAQASSAESDRRALGSQPGFVSSSLGLQCLTASACAQLADVHARRDAADDRFLTGIAVTSGLWVATMATLFFWPNVPREKVQLAPQASSAGGGLTLVGRF
ncbi:MAG: hypothetical protein KC657_10515 [Myxococcales bacterium]|nr:hypothetical protein [Myxococcales bacterium]